MKITQLIVRPGTASVRGPILRSTPSSPPRHFHWRWLLLAATYCLAFQLAGSAVALGMVAASIGVRPPPSPVALIAGNGTPANDNFENAQVLSKVNIAVPGTTLMATTQYGEPSISGVVPRHTVWYQWTAPSAGYFTVSAVSSNVDTLLAVFTGGSISSLTLIAASDNSADGNSDSLARFYAEADTTYQVVVGDDANDGGPFTLTLTNAAWEAPLLDAVTSSPAVAIDGTIYFGGRDGFVYAYNPDGSQRWWTVPSTTGYFDLASPALADDDTVYLGSSDGYLYALDGNDGSMKWRFRAGSPLSTTPAVAGDGTIYLRDTSNLYALRDEGSSFSEKWGLPLASGTASSPAIGLDGTIYVGGTGGVLYAIAPAGQLRWTVTTEGDVTTSPAVAYDGTIYVGTTAGRVYAVNSNGTVKWSWAADSGPNTIGSSIAIGADNTIYFGSTDHNLYAVAADGSLRWRFAAGDQITTSSPAIATDGTVYIGSTDGLVYAVSPAGTLVQTYPSAGPVLSSPAIANGRLYFGSNDAKLHAFDVGQTAAATAWPMFHQGQGRHGRFETTVVSVTAEPVPQTVMQGGTATLSVTASSGDFLAYQWYKDGGPIAGANNASYTIANAVTADAGSYEVLITCTYGSVWSSPATITVLSAAPGHLANLSVRARAGSGTATLIVGFVISGTDKPVLIRGIGPSLASYGIVDPLQDPQLVLYADATRIQSNDNWGGSDTLANTFDSVGAFPLGRTSLDAALLQPLPPGVYSAHVSEADGMTGVALAEIYDTAVGTGGNLVNLSARADVGTGSDVLIAGFVVAGAGPKTLLIRAVGPTLSSFGVTGVLADPRLDLYRQSTLLQSNDNWAGTSALKSVFAQVGAFALPDDSKDAALLVTLNPGIYSAVVSGVQDTTGIALVEVYDVQ